MTISLPHAEAMSPSTRPATSCGPHSRLGVT